MFYVYAIKNKGTGELYLGYTSDLKRRLKEHRDRSPELVYYEAYKRKEDAQEREKKLKQRGQSVRWLKSRLGRSLES